jgi:hypothetical protein
MFQASSCPSLGEQYKATTPMVYSTGRAEADSRRRGGSVCNCWDWFHDHSQQLHTEPPLLLESAAARPVLYTIGVVGCVLFSWWWAWWCPKHVGTPINTSSFLHLVGYLFTFMIQDARSHEISNWGVFDRASLSRNNVYHQLDATKVVYWCSFSSTRFGPLRPSSGTLEIEYQHMVFCTQLRWLAEDWRVAV